MCGPTVAGRSRRSTGRCATSCRSGRVSATSSKASTSRGMIVTVDAGKLGFERDSEEFRVNTARLAQFAAALDDTNPAHREGRIAGPVFHHIPVMQSMVEVMTAATREFALHGEHDFHFYRPIEPRQRLFSRSQLIGVGATRVGTTLVIRSDIRTHDDQLVSTQYSTCLVTSAKSAASVGSTGPERPSPPPDRDPITG